MLKIENFLIKVKTKTKIFLVSSIRVTRFTKDITLIFFYVINNLIKYKKMYEDDIVFVSAIEKNYFSQIKSLLHSYEKYLNNKFILYDLGMEENQIEFIKNNHRHVEIRNFSFTHYPKFISRYFDDKLGNYAWKPVIIDDVLNESSKKVVWLDAGNLIDKKITFLKIALTAKGIIVPISSNRIKDWTHKITQEYIGLSKKHLNKSNYASGLIGFDFNSPKAKQISHEWKEYSLIQDCISPPGSSRKNHRQDQAVLTLILYKNLFKNRFVQLTYPSTNFILGVLFHKKKIFDF